MTSRAREMETQEQYRLLLHSLTHEDTEMNIERHVLVISKWLRDNDEGILLRDLEYVSQMLVVMRRSMVAHPAAFRPLVVKFLKLSCKPILETKANERLRQKSINDMRVFFTEIATFFKDGADNLLKIEVAHTLRCICCGGKDPAILRADQVPWKEDGTKFQIVDTTLLQSIIRESAVIEKVVDEFTTSVEQFEKGTLDFQQTVMSFSQNNTFLSDKSVVEGADAMLAPSEELKDNFAEYGLPSPDGAAPSASSAAEDYGFASPTSLDGDGAAAAAGSLEQALNATNPSRVLRAKKKEIGHVERVVQEILGLCSDLSADPKCCHAMGALRICDALMHYLQYIAAENMKDKRVGALVSMVWTIMEAYLAQATALWEKAKQVESDGGGAGGAAGAGGAMEGGEAPGLDLSLAPELAEVLDTEQAVAVMHQMLQRFAADGFRDTDKECRNECLAILTLVADSPASHAAFYQSGLLHDLIYLACSAEANESLQSDADSDMGSPSRLGAWLGTHPQSVSSKLRNFATVSELDLQFKRVLWMLISDLIKGDDPTALQCVADSPLLFALLAYVKFDTLSAPDGNLAGTSSSGSVAGSRRLMDHAGSHASQQLPAGGPGGGPSDLASKDSSTVAGGGSRDFRLGSVVHWEEGNAFRDRPPSAGDTSYATGPTVEPFVDQKKSIHLPLKDVALAVTREPQQKTFFSSVPRVEMRELQVLAMMFLAENAWKFPASFFAIDGPLKVYEVAMHYCTSEHAEHKALVGYALILFNRLLTTSQRVRALMEQLNAVQLLLFMFEMSEDEGTKAQAVRAIALLCSNGNDPSAVPTGNVDDADAAPLGPAPDPLVCQAQMRQQGGIPLLVQAMKTHVSAKRPLAGLRAGVKVIDKYNLDPEDPALQPLSGDVSVYVIAVLDCVAKAVVGNRLNEATFAKCDGVDLLLEMAEVAPCVLRFQVLRVISDILENRDLVVHARLWKSPKTMRTAAQLATHCWLDEEVRLDGARVPGQGVVCNLIDPLGNHVWPIDAVAQVMPGGETNSSASTVTTEVSAKSLAVTRLATAIFQSRFNNNLAKGNVGLAVRNKVLEKDVRGVVASILQLLGVFDTPSVLDVDAHNYSLLSDNGGPESDEVLGGALHQQSINPSMVVHDGKGSPLPADGSRTMFDERLERSHSDASSPGRVAAAAAAASVAALGGQGSGSYAAVSPAGALSPQQNSVGSLRSPQVVGAAGSGLMGPSQLAVGVEESAVLLGGARGEGSLTTDDLELAVFERQVVAIARRYAVLREGSWWTELQDSLRRDGVTPIEADLNMIQVRLGQHFEAAQTVQMEQMALQDLGERGRKVHEKRFIDSILSMKTQEFKAELLKHNSKANKTRVNPFTAKK